MEDYISDKEALQHLGVDEKTLSDMVSGGTVRARVSGAGDWLYSSKDIMALAKKKTSEAPRDWLRDFFAAAALRGIVSSSYYIDRASSNSVKPGNGDFPTNMARFAYRQADAMLAVRDEKKGDGNA